MMSLVGVMTLAGCTQVDEAVVEAAARETGVPIVFECGDGTDSAGETHGTRAVNGTTGFASPTNGHLKYMGFGIFAREKEDATAFDFMSNQKVEYTFLADKPDGTYDGYWTYQPLKYWPYKYKDAEQKNVAKSMVFCAYAPYVDRPETSLDPGTTGVIDVAANDETPSVTYARGKTLEDCVDLLWSYEETPERDVATEGVPKVKMDMMHALARVSVKVTLTGKASNIDKVLVEQVKLSGTFATEGTLDLTSHDEVTIGTGLEAVTFRRPNWTVNESEATSIVIDSNPTQYHEMTSDYSYGTISESIHYAVNAINGVPLPKDRQPPDGLKLNETQNVLVQDDEQETYLLFIPQASLSLTAHTVLHVYYNDGTADATVKRTGTATVIGEPTIEGNPLYGNRTYKLNLQVEL